MRLAWKRGVGGVVAPLRGVRGAEVARDGFTHGDWSARAAGAPSRGPASDALAVSATARAAIAREDAMARGGEIQLNNSVI